MKNNMKIQVIGILLIAICSSCKKEGIEKGMTKQLKKEIKTFQKDDSLCDEAKIVERDYDGYKLYLFENSCLDGLTVVRNEEGSQICEFGGISGLTCDDPNFNQDLVSEQVLWSN
ncbi:MAG: hypothetical protein MRY83_24910 [Flavobacteriales bacterium]|nr:hypothetical protein [Flavobacteriales bacterium]